ncbi:MAG: hypothetical protein V1815_02095 [Candidatus Woesearchaeota archaeon]
MENKIQTERKPLEILVVEDKHKDLGYFIKYLKENINTKKLKEDKFFKNHSLDYLKFANFTIATNYEDAINELDKDYDGLICDFNFPGKKESIESIKEQIKKHGNKERLYELASKVTYLSYFGNTNLNYKDIVKGFDINQFEEKLEKNIESDHCPLGPIVSIKAKQRNIPYIFATNELFHAGDAIPLAAYVGVIDKKELLDGLHKLSMNGYTYKTIREGGGCPLTKNLAIGEKEIGVGWSLALSLLKDKIHLE